MSDPLRSLRGLRLLASGDAHHLFWLLAALLLPAIAGAGGLDPAQALKLPGVVSLLPAGTRAGDPQSIAGPVLTTAVQSTGTAANPSPLRIAMVVLDPLPGQKPPYGASGPSRRAKLIVARQERSKMVAELQREGQAADVYELTMGPLRPGGALALAVQWLGGPGPHEGKLEIWAFGAERPVSAFGSNVESFYFEDVDGSGHAELVVYQPEAGSLVYLPKVFDWKGDKLVLARGKHDRLEKRLLADFEEVLQSYKAAGQAGDPPRMVMDIALQKGRLLERRGDERAAFDAYADAIDLVPDNLLVVSSQVDDRRDTLERVAEARRRAAGIYVRK